MKLRRLLLPAIALALACPSLHAQGLLTPPSGPVAPTMKSLDQIEARTPIQSLPGNGTSQYIISKPGSYYLTGDIAGVSGKSCISIQNTNVTIDLNGFTLTGASGSLIGIDGSSASGEIITNGRITGFPGLGMSLSHFSHAHLENLVVTNCVGGGASIGDNAIVRNCTFQSCGSATAPSVIGYNQCLIDHCVISENPGGDGVQVDYGSIVSNCIVSGNIGSGVVAVGASVRIASNNCMGNEADGIRATTYADIVDCTCSLTGLLNTTTGIGIHLTGTGGRIDHCTTSNNRGRGIVVDGTNAATVVTRNSSTGNTGANYAIPSGNRPALIVTYSAANGYTSGDPLANTQ
jgi:hypothetical protein